MSAADLFTESSTANQPLAARMRPETLDQYVGQAHLLGKDKPLRKVLEADHLHSMIFWGPPGVGKTSLANLIAHHTHSEFLAVSAIMSGVKDVRAAVERAQFNQQQGRRTLLFLDEAHRFNKSQQDAFLPHVESGTLVFIGATTENPSFELNNALLSRCRVYKLQTLAENELAQLLDNALTDADKGLGKRQLTVSDDAERLLIAAANGDSRRLYNLLEISADLVEDGAQIDADTVTEVAGQQYRNFDKGGDEFYDQISALHKSVRGSDPDASLYWMCRMLDGGCDPLYIARRVVRMATEDIGNADPRALQLALNAWEVQERLGAPEGELAIAQAVVFMACAAKSNAVYTALKAAKTYIGQQGNQPVPIHLRNAPTKLLKEFGHGADYQYDHDFPDALSTTQSFWPDDMPPQSFYQPTERGLEKKIAEKLRWIAERRQ